MTSNNLVEINIYLLCLHSKLWDSKCILKLEQFFLKCKIEYQKKKKKKATQVFQNFGSVGKWQTNTFFFRPYNESSDAKWHITRDCTLAVCSHSLMRYLGSIYCHSLLPQWRNMCMPQCCACATLHMHAQKGHSYFSRKKYMTLRK